MYTVSLPVTTFSLHSTCGINAPQHERNSLRNSKQKKSILTFWSPHVLHLQSTFSSQSGDTLPNGAKHCSSSSPGCLRACGQASAGSQPDTSPRATFLTLRPLRDFQRWKARLLMLLCLSMIKKHHTLHVSFTMAVDQWPAKTLLQS